MGVALGAPDAEPEEVVANVASGDERLVKDAVLSLDWVGQLRSATELDDFEQELVDQTRALWRR